MKKSYTGWIPRFKADGSLHGIVAPEFRKPISPPPPLLSDRISSRPCEVDSKICTFHRWIDESKVIFKVQTLLSAYEIQQLSKTFYEDNIVRPGCCIDIIRTTLALVEYPDGSVGKVDPSLVTFLDKEVK